MWLNKSLVALKPPRSHYREAIQLIKQQIRNPRHDLGSDILVKTKEPCQEQVKSTAVEESEYQLRLRRKDHPEQALAEAISLLPGDEFPLRGRPGYKALQDKIPRTGSWEY